MKGLKTLTAALSATALLACAAPASAGADAYKHYVGCGISKNTKPSHSCPKAGKKGAFFKSLNADVFYKVCVKLPTGNNLCAGRQEATQGKLEVNTITSHRPGRYKVSWFVGGQRVGLFFFHIPH